MPLPLQEVNERMDRFADQCRERRLVATPQRRAIYRELARSSRHPSAESIHQLVRPRIPSLSLDTVYRTLRFFEKQGLIERVGSDGERARFDANTTRHAHFICKLCGCVEDLPNVKDYSIPDYNPKLISGLIHSVHLEFRGFCHKCNNSVQSTDGRVSVAG